METTFVIQKPQKKQKLNSKSLGNLPEEVLLHILSFLPTKDAVRTSVLCRRWEYLWSSIPNLDFHLSLWLAQGNRKRMLSMNFVDRALCLRDSDIKRFTLRCDLRHDTDASRVNTWISAAVRHNVQELYIELHHNSDHEEFSVSLPYRMFTCKTLTSLHLNMRSTILKLPTTICFSNLKILTIENVIFPLEYFTSKLFSGLPVLEELKLKDCNWGVLKFLSICAPNLHSLSISEWEMIDEDFWISGDFCQVMIVGDSLKEFYYEGHLLSEYCLSNSFSLEKAEIRSDFECQLQQNHMFKLFTGLSNVKLLRLSCDVVGVLDNSAEHLPSMPMFNNLTDLIFFEDAVNLDSTALLKILQKSPYLKTLNFSRGIRLSFKWKEDDGILDPVPPCFLSHLKWIKVCYNGNEKELFGIKILLKNAVVLNKMILICSKHLAENLEEQVKVSKQLLELPRGSQNCKIILK